MSTRIAAALRWLVARLRGRNENAVCARELTLHERSLILRRALAASSAAFERDRISVVRLSVKN